MSNTLMLRATGSGLLLMLLANGVCLLRRYVRTQVQIVATFTVMKRLNIDLLCVDKQTRSSNQSVGQDEQ